MEGGAAPGASAPSPPGRLGLALAVIALKSGVAYLPYVPAILAATVVTQRAVSRIGARPPLIAGGVIAAGGMVWLSRITEHSTCAGGMLGPVLLLGAGLGMMLTPVFLIGLTRVSDDDTGIASGLVNMGQQVGGSIGLAVIGTVAWSAVTSSVRSQAAAAARAGVHAGRDGRCGAGGARGYRRPPPSRLLWQPTDFDELQAKRLGLGQHSVECRLIGQHAGQRAATHLLSLQRRT